MAIATQDIAITATPIDLSTATDPDLSAEDSVVIENTSNGIGTVLRIAELAAAPTGDALDSNYLPIAHGEGYVATIEADLNIYVWSTTGETGRITVSNG